MCRDLVTGGADAKGNALEQILSVTGGNMDELGRLNATYDLITMPARHKVRGKISPDSQP